MALNPQPHSPALHPDGGLRVFVSSVLQELAQERASAREAIQTLKLAPVLFELGARPHPPQTLYRTYLEKSQVFVGIYWQRYGWVAPGMEISGLEDEYRLAAGKPRLIYIKEPAPEREPRLQALLQTLDGEVRRVFSSAKEFSQLLQQDLAQLVAQESQSTAEAVVSTSPTPPPSRLPIPLTSMIRREDEVREVRQLLLRPEVHWVTLSGPGGVGKTRLALEAARGLEAGFPDGAEFISLVMLNDPALVAPAIARAFGLIEAAHQSLWETLKEFLQNKRLLLLLDGFEPVASAAPLVAELLSHAPGVKVLATSRTDLHLAAEQEYPVLPLELPSPSASAQALQANEAVQLFVERAKASKPGFALTEENAVTVAEICRRLDGLPLAIELAAVRIKLLNEKQLLQRLSDPLEFLISGPRDLPLRQQTLRATIDWSYRLLSPDEQALSTHFAVFVDGATLEATLAVCGDEQHPDLFETLSGLVEKNLLEQYEVQSEPRFRMLQTIREFALEKLEQGGQAQGRRKAHAQYFLELAEVAHGGRFGSGQMAWLERLEAEQGNHRAALAWFVEHRQAEPALRLAASLRWFWDLRGRFSEGRRWLNAALELTGEIPPLVKAAALIGAGVLAWRQGDYGAARPLMEQGLALRRAHNDIEGVANALQNLGNLATHLGDFAAARSYQDENLLLRREFGSKDAIADALFSRGNVALVEGQLAQAKALYQESLAHYREAGDTLGLPFVLVNLAEVARLQGDYDGAYAQAEEAQRIAEGVKDRLRFANALQSLGLSHRDQGHSDQAWKLLEQSLSIYRELGHGLKIGFVTSELGTVMLQKAAYDTAERLFSEGLKTHQALGLKPGIAYAMLGLAEVARAKGNPSEALRLIREGLPIAQTTTDKLTVARYLETLALLQLQPQPETSARLLGAANALRQVSEVVLPPAERANIENGLEELRAKLEPARFQALWAEGQTTAIEEAISKALEASSGIAGSE